MKKILIALTSAVIILFALAACTAQETVPEQTENTTEYIYAEDSDGYSRSVSFRWAYYESIEDLAARARRYIVRVEVLDERTERIDQTICDIPFEHINTVHRLRVLEVFQGDTQPGEVIELAQIGGELDGETTVTSLDLVPLTVGEELIMFLSGACPEEYSDFPDVVRYVGIMNPRQGIYRVPPASLGGQDIATQADDTVLESLHPDNNLVLTVGDLARIAAASE